MTLREQIISAMEDNPFVDDENLQGTTQQGMRFAHYTDIAITLIANPDDEMVERCARALDHPSVYMGGASEQSKRNARAVLKAIGGV